MSHSSYNNIIPQSIIIVLDGIIHVLIYISYYWIILLLMMYYLRLLLLDSTLIQLMVMVIKLMRFHYPHTLGD